MATRSFLLLGFAQIAKHEFVNVLPHGCVELVFNLNGVVAAFGLNGFKLTTGMHFAQEVKLLAALVVFVLAYKQIRLQAVARPCLQTLNLGRVERAVALGDCDQLTR